MSFLRSILNSTSAGVGASRSPVVRFFLVCVFLAAAAFPILVAKSLFQSPELEEGSSAESEISDVPIVLNANTDRRYFSIQDHPSLNPEVGKDFLFFSWISLRKTPELGPPLYFAAKFDSSRLARNGYSYGFQRLGEDFHLMTSWKNAKGEGEEFRFAETNFIPKRWYLLLYLFSDDKYLSAYRLYKDERDESIFERLGAFEMEELILPLSSEPLLFGVGEGGRLRARFGPLGLLTGNELSDKVEDIAGSLTRFDGELDLPGDSVAELLLFDSSGNRTDRAFVIEGLGSASTAPVVERRKERAVEAASKPKGKRKNNSSERPQKKDGRRGKGRS